MATTKDQKRRWYLENRELSLERSRTYRRNHPEWAKKVALNANRSEHSKTWRERNPEKAKILARRTSINRRLKKYGLTLESYLELKESQNNLCAICGEVPAPLKGKTGAIFLDNFVIDHDHRCCPDEGSCGKCVRGLTCSACNVAAGMLRDDPDRARKLAEYLENNAPLNSGLEVRSSDGSSLGAS